MRRHHWKTLGALARQSPALNALNAAADAMDAPPPCTGDPRFTAEDRATRLEVVALCGDCPLIAACYTAGRREAWGIWGGRDRAPRYRRYSLDTNLRDARRTLTHQEDSDVHSIDAAS